MTRTLIVHLTRLPAIRDAIEQAAAKVARDVAARAACLRWRQAARVVCLAARTRDVINADRGLAPYDGGDAQRLRGY